MINKNSKDYAFGYLQSELDHTIKMMSILSGVFNERDTLNSVWDQLKERRDYLDRNLNEIEEQEGQNENI